MSVIRVNKYMLRHKGVTYRPGDTVEMEDSMAEALAEQSAGAFSLVPSKKIASGASNEPPVDNIADKDDAIGEDEVSENQADVSAVLAAADKKPPAKTTSAKRKTSAGAKK